MSRAADRIFETTVDQGTGALDLDGALSSAWRAFSDVFSNGATVYYMIEQSGGDDGWEVGQGTLNTGTPDTLSRDTVFASSNADAEVDWGPGTKNVFCVMPPNAMADLGMVAGNESAARDNLGASSGIWPATVGGTGESDAAGLGSQDAPLPPNNDLDDVVRTGFNRTNGATSNKPASSDFFAVMTIRYDETGTRFTQLAFRADTDLDLALSGPWWRAGEGGAWTGWKRLPFDRASQGQAEAGTVEHVYMDPFRVAQAIAAQAPAAGSVEGPPVIKTLASAMANIGTSFVDVTGLAIPMGANETWIFEWHVTINGAAGVEFRLAFNGPSSPDALAFNSVLDAGDDVSSYDADIVQRNGTGQEHYIVSAYVENGANAGNFVCRARSANVGDGDVRAGSFLKGWRVA